MTITKQKGSLMNAVTPSRAGRREWIGLESHQICFTGSSKGKL